MTKISGGVPGGWHGGMLPGASSPFRFKFDANGEADVDGEVAAYLMSVPGPFALVADYADEDSDEMPDDEDTEDAADDEPDDLTEDELAHVEAPGEVVQKSSGDPHVNGETVAATPKPKRPSRPSRGAARRKSLD